MVDADASWSARLSIRRLASKFKKFDFLLQQFNGDLPESFENRSLSSCPNSCTISATELRVLFCPEALDWLAAAEANNY